jgi:hypothetical protein
MTVSIALGRFGYGVLRVVQPGVLMHWCDACSRTHQLDVHALNHNGKVIGWDGDVERPSIGETVRHVVDGQICEYLLKGGVVYYMSSCSHAMAGKSAHLRDCPAEE